MIKFRMWPVLATGALVLSVGSYAIADDDDDEDENEVSVEVEATNDAGFKLEVEVEGTSLGFIDLLRSDPGFFGDLRGEAKLTDPDGNECEVEIGASNNGIGLSPNPNIGFFPRLALYSAATGNVVVIIRHTESMRIVISRVSKVEFVGCNVGSPTRIIPFPGDQTEVEIEEG